MPPRRNGVIKPATTTATATRGAIRRSSNNTITSNAFTAAQPATERADDNGNDDGYVANEKEKHVDDEEQEDGDEEEDDPNLELSRLFEKLHKAVCISLSSTPFFLAAIRLPYSSSFSIPINPPQYHLLLLRCCRHRYIRKLKNETYE